MTQPSTQRAFEQAVLRHRAGRMREAEQIYQQVLAEDASHAGAIYGLGLIAAQAGRNDVAVDLIRRALTLMPNSSEARYNLGNALKGNGQLEEGIAALRDAITLKPNFPEAHNNLGIALHEMGIFDEAIAEYRQAIGLKPDFHEAHVNFGIALQSKGRLDEAIAAYGRALALNPHSPEAHSNLGHAFRARGQLDEAIAAYRQAVALRPNHAETHHNLGMVLKKGGHLDEAIASYRRALALRPNYVEAHNNLGNALKDSGRLDEAIAAYGQAIAINPTSAVAHCNLGDVQREKGRLDAAIAACRRAIALDPNLPEAHNNLSNALMNNGQLDEAVAACRQAIALNPRMAKALCNLGSALRDRGQLDAAVCAYRQAVALEPDNAVIDSNLVYTLHYHPAYDACAIAVENRRWSRRHADALREFFQPYSNDRAPDRRLRIGYVSPDFREHVVGRNLLPLFERHDREQFEITCYAQVANPDAMTSRLRQSADAWRNIVGLSDDRAAKQIRDDRIDVLVDVALHTANNRLLVFARRPAPVQVTYLAYSGSSGMSAMDYRLSDPHLDPPGTDLSCYAEETVHLPRTYWCYQPGVAPAVVPAPALKNRFVTFGCLNNFAKASPMALDLWARILAAVPGSRMIIHAPAGEYLKDVEERFQRVGVARTRLQFVGMQPWTQYAQTYSQIDIALDPSPYGGGVTTCDALWMGVPVVSLSGQTSVGRGGRSILSNLGLPELISFTPDQFAAIAIELARDPVRMDGLRGGMRGRMLASPLMDAATFARDMEAVFRQMWQTWCGTVSAES